MWRREELKALNPSMPVSDFLQPYINSAKNSDAVDSWEVRVEPAELEMDVNIDFE